ncbi:hypothetical protein [Myroides sp. DW712]|uniref:hypothetical protein n=1 Tax=Myroides sp. DW712 TaxID=3389800 RepID=UPI00397DED04
MKKRLIPIALVMGAISANAQVGIGTPTPNKSAELTIQADRRGLLIPNVSLADTKDSKTIEFGNVNSLLVWNTATEKDVTPGYYYWFVDKWERLTADSDIPAIVVNNFENILNMEGDKVTNLIKNIVRNTEGNVIYEGDKLYYINADGDKVEINFGDIVAANESKTVVVSNTSKKQQYYISESYLQVNDTPTQATIDTWTAGTVPAGVYAIDVVGGVVNNFEEVVNHGPINVDGRSFPTINDYITYLTESTGGFTKIVYDPTTGDAIFQEWDEATNTWVNVSNAKFKKIVTDNESKTVIVSNTSKKQQYYIAEAYVQTNGLPTQVTIDAWTVGNTPEGVYAIDVVGGVVNNFQEFVNHGPITVDGRTYPTVNDYITYLTESTGGFTKIVYDSQNRNASFQQWDEATSSWVNVINSKFKKIITDNESQTQIITVDGNQYYVSEAYLAVNDGVVPTTVNPANLPAGIYAIDVVGGVVNNFEEIVTNGPITVDGRTYPTINDYITHLTETTGGFTKIVYDQTTGDVIFQEWDESTNTWVNVDNSKFETIVQANESKTTIITVDGNQYYVSEEYLIANNGVAPTTVNPANLPAGIYAIDVVGGVVNNFEEIVTNGPITVDGRTYPTINDYITHLTETTGGFTKIVYDQTTGDVIFQEWDESTNTWVNVDNSKFETIVQANESKTTVITVDGNQYYVSEEYLIAHDGVVPTTVTATNLPAGIYAIDVVGGVVNNFEEIVTNGPITVDGRTYPTINDYITHLTETTGGFTKIVYDQTTGDVIFQEWDETTNTWVNVDNSKFKTIVTDNETVTKLVKNTNGTYTYYNEKEIGADGEPLAGATGVTIDPALVIVEDKSKSEGTYIFKDSEGNEIATIDINSDNILYDNSDSGLTSTNVKDALDELATTIATTKGDLSVAGGLEFTGTTDGTAKLLADAGIQIADGGVATDKIAEGAVTADKLTAGQGEAGRVGVAGADGTITYKTLDEVVKANETVTVFVENPNGTYTYYNEDEIGADGLPKAGATGVTIDPKEVSIELNTTTNVYEFKDSNGAVIGEIDANANAIAFDDSTTNLNVTNVQGAIEKLLEKITTVEGTTGDLTVAGGLEFTGTTNGTAKLLADAGIQIADKGVTAAKLDAGKGEDGRVGVADGEGNVTYQIIDTVVKANETVTVLVQNADGTFTYYNENEIGADGQPKAGAAGVTIDPKDVSVVLNPTTNVYEFKNTNGDVIGEIDANANAIAFDDSTTNLDVTNVQEAIEKLLTKITTVEGTTGNLTSPSIYVDGGADALLKDAKIDLKGGSADGQVLVTVTKNVVVGQNPDGSDIVESRKVTEWQDPKEVVSTTVTAKNGITVVNDADGNSEFRLGGPLDAVTVITTSTTNTLAIAGMENVTTSPAANNLVIAGDDGVLKQTSPKNMIEDVITQGDLEAKMLKGVGITVTAGENAGTNLNTEVASSLLKDVTLGIADKAVTAGKLDAGTSTTDAPRIGVADQNGNVTYEDLQTVVQAEQKTVVLEDGTNTTVSSRVDAANPNETIWKVDVATAVKTVAVSTPLAATDAVVLVNAEAAPTEGIVITLPDADATNKGKKYTIKKLDTNEDGYVVIAGNVAGLNGKTLETGLPYSGWDFVSDGTQWQIVNKF